MAGVFSLLVMPTNHGGDGGAGGAVRHTAETVTQSQAPVIGSIEGPGTVIGRYTLIERIGTGGFGAVFLAEQREPVVRQVALKVLKLGMDTEHVIARFEQERQALALMDHPHIAKVLDAGATSTGRPYFVMELVTGEPITDFCDAQAFTVRQRIELFIQVANAIQHAHQKGIIHRDIKPSNILVSIHDGQPHARVIDFGIAKAIAQPLTGETMHTRLGQFMGTPLYMSPEQSEGSLDVDTRTDVYSLGVVLYELLTGTTPFDPESFESSSIIEQQRVIREVDPPRPSARLSASKDTLPDLAVRRSTEAGRLAPLLRRELDWIVMKALEKEPDRRYETANALAMDLGRYLAGEPVVAAPPSTVYRMRKFVGRHRGAVFAASVVALALVGGLAGTLWQANVAARQRDAARQEAARATALNDFMRQMLTASDPEMQGSHEVTVAELLAKASQTATTTLADQPEAEAEARTLLGSTFGSLGKIDQAVAELERAIALHRNGVGRYTLAHSRVLRELALVRRDQGEFDAAIALYREALGIVESLGEERFDELVVVHYELAQIYSRASRFDEAEQELDRSEALLDRRPVVDPGRKGSILAERSTLASAKGDFELADRQMTEALALHRQAGEPWKVADSLNSLAVIKLNRDELDSAIALHEEAIAIVRKIYGESTPVLALQLENLGGVYLKLEQYDKTIAILEQVLAIRESIYGASSFAVARTRYNMGVVAYQTGDYRRALALVDQTLPVFREHAGEKSQEVAFALRQRANCRDGLGDLDGAAQDYQSSLATMDALGSEPANPSRLQVVLELLRIQCRRGATASGALTLDQTITALDPGKPEQKEWIERLQKTLDDCG
jgi:tetratricopeptide (TPR) repeat protein